MTDLNELLIFTKVVQSGSFTAAALALGMPKSSVSRKVSDLEERIGARLLQRTTRKLGLTDAGRIYFERSARIVAEVEEAEGAVHQLQSSPRGLLKITSPLSFAMLGPIVGNFLRRYPEVQVELMSTDRRVDLVNEGFDLAIRAGKLDDSTLIARTLGSIRRVLIAAPAYLKKAGTPREPEELSKHACLAFSAAPAPSVWVLQREGEGQAREVRVTPRLAVNDFELMREVALTGVGVGLMPEFLCAAELKAGTLKRLLPGWCSSEAALHAVYPSTRHLSPKVVAFIELLKVQFQLPLPGSPGRDRR
jgi:DNA-binding transcriptional LysR family regulator